MINPGVLVLAKKNIGKTYSCLEDNIGESIHFHYGNIRLDLTIDEFLETSKKLVDVARELLGPISNELFKYDPVFLNYISDHLSDLERIENDSIELDKIICYGCVSDDTLGPVYLVKSSRFLALNGDTRIYESIDRDKPLFMTHIERLNSVREFVRNSDNIGNIVLLNDTNIILDGQHRAAVLLHDEGNRIIPIKRFYFHNYKLNYKVHGKIYYVFKNLKKKIKKTIRRFVG